MFKRAINAFGPDILTLIIIAMCVLPIKSFCQEPEQTRNTISIEGASYVYIGNYTISYERVIVSSPKYNLNLSAGIGGWYFFPVSRIYYGNSLPVAINNLFGSGKHRFEVTAGARYTFLKERTIQIEPPPAPQEIPKIMPVLNIGYRYQDPTGKGLMFRAFIGFNGIGIGVGKAF